MIISRGQTMYYGRLDELRKSAAEPGDRAAGRPGAAGRRRCRRRRSPTSSRLPDGQLAVAGATVQQIGDIARAGRRRAVRRAGGAGRPGAAVLPAHQRSVRRARPVAPGSCRRSAGRLRHPAGRLPPAAGLPAAPPQGYQQPGLPATAQQGYAPGTPPPATSSSRRRLPAAAATAAAAQQDPQRQAPPAAGHATGQQPGAPTRQPQQPPSATGPATRSGRTGGND